MELKQYGCKLYEIKELMENRNSQKLKAMLQDRNAKLSIEINRLMNTSIILEKRISEIIKEEACKMNSGKILIVNEVYKIFSNRVSAEFSGEFVVIGRLRPKYRVQSGFQPSSFKTASISFIISVVPLEGYVLPDL